MCRSTCKSGRNRQLRYICIRFGLEKKITQHIYFLFNFKDFVYNYSQGWGAGVGCFGCFESEPQGWGAGVRCFGSFEPEPLEKKTGAGAAWKKSQELEPLKN